VKFTRIAKRSSPLKSNTLLGTKATFSSTANL